MAMFMVIQTSEASWFCGGYVNHIDQLVILPMKLTALWSHPAENSSQSIGVKGPKAALCVLGFAVETDGRLQETE
jgi:hypothetical protein